MTTAEDWWQSLNRRNDFRLANEEQLQNLKSWSYVDAGGQRLGGEMGDPEIIICKTTTRISAGPAQDAKLMILPTLAVPLDAKNLRRKI